MNSAWTPEITAALAATPSGVFVGGEWSEPAAGGRLETADPATGGTLTAVADAGPTDVDRAVAAARAALRDPAWADSTPARREEWLRRLADLLDADREAFALLETLDNGMPIKLAERLVDRAVGNLRYYAGWPTKMSGSTIEPSTPGGRNRLWAYTLREPLGVVAAIIPWNASITSATTKLAPGPRLRQHRRPQAVGEHAADRPAAGQADRGARPAAPASSTSSAAARTRAARWSSTGCRNGRLHRLDRGRPVDRPRLRRDPEAGAGRARRQVAEHHLRRRRHAPGGARRRPRDLRQYRSGLHRGLAHLRRPRGPRRGRRGHRQIRREAADRPGPRPADPARAGGQRRPEGAHPGRRRRRPGGRRDPGHRRLRGRGRRPRRRLLRRSRRSSPGSTRRCASPARRSSARSPR